MMYHVRLHIQSCNHFTLPLGTDYKLTHSVWQYVPEMSRTIYLAKRFSCSQITIFTTFNLLIMLCLWN